MLSQELKMAREDMQFNEEELEALVLADIYEDALTTQRIAEILDSPDLVPGNFDLNHLINMHEYIFQDFPEKWIEQNETTAEFFHYLQPEMLMFEPGQLREEREPFNPVEKYREIGDGKFGSISHYSCNSEGDLGKAEQMLAAASPENLKQMSKREVIESMVNLYEELDFVHPFSEGNSRTLRTFTKLLAQEAGVDLNWSNINREELYAARDISLNTKTIEYFTQKASEAPFDTEMVDKARANLMNLESKGYKNMQELFAKHELDLELPVGQDMNHQNFGM